MMRPASSEEEKPARPRWLLPLLVVGGVGVVIVYDQFARPPVPEGELPLIEAPEGAMKRTPDNPGGMQLAHRDNQIYSLLDPAGAAKPQRERLLPPPEEPLRTEPPTFLESALPEVVIEERPQAPETEAAIEQVTLSREPAPPAPKVEPKPTPKPDKSAGNDAEFEPGIYRIQLASLTDKKTAEAEAKRLQRKHRSLLGEISLKATQASIGERKLWRVQGGALSERSARTLCVALKAQKASCLVVKP